MVRTTAVRISFHASRERECIYSELTEICWRDERREASWVGRSAQIQESADNTWKLTDLMPDLPFNGRASF